MRVQPVGELDLRSSPDVDRALQQLYAAGFERVILDLRAVSFIDSAGVHMVMKVHEAARRAGVQLELVVGPPQVQRAFELTATVGLLPFRLPTRSEAAIGRP